ncbi:MAG: hypothetical protein QGG48_00930 [Desulfatiglandales bacterium]|jgi:hypothetical protein|nr:hypothetical protein [Desulfatiglandales bacterium]
MVKEKNEKEMFVCPLGKFFFDLEKTFGRKTKFFGHLTQSRIEFLKAIKSLVDERIENLEEKDSGKEKKRMTKIKVD